MVPPKRTLAIVALTTTLLGCSSRPVPATAPPLPTESLQLYATTATVPLVNDLTTAYRETQFELSFETQTANYETSLENLYDDERQYILTNHLPPDSPLWAAPIGQDGIAIVTHPAINLRDITIEQLRSIYQGRTVKWNELSNNDGEIIVFSREAGSGTRAEFERMVMGQRQTTMNALVAASSQHMLESIASTEGSIGYVSSALLTNQVNTLAINGVQPSQDNIYNDRYPLRSLLYIVGAKEPTDHYRQFIGWVQSSAGQSVVARRYVPLLEIREQDSIRQADG